MTQRERASILRELSPPIDVFEPSRQTVPVIFSSPHSGRIYPTALIEASRLPLGQLRRSEDFYVDEIFHPVTRLGAPLVAARFPRVYLDVNREPYELDPALFDERVPDFANTRSLRVAGGLGTIARIVGDCEEIYRNRMPLAAAFERIERLHKPYHRAMAELIQQTRAAFGLAIIIDCHSMPSANVADQPGGGGRPHFVIGDRFGSSCDSVLVRFLRAELQQQGYDVALNRPYAGGYITEHYGQPRHGVHALQIEINRSLYMDEANLTLSAGYASLQRNIGTVVERLFEWLPAMTGRKAAAE